MENTRIDLPSFAYDEPVGASMLEDAVVALVPLFQASTDIGLGRTRFEAHVGMGKIVFHLVVLRWKVVCLRLSLLSYEPGEFVGLMQVVRDGAQVVEEFAKQIPPAFAVHHPCTKQQITGGFDGIPQKKFFAVVWLSIAQTLVRQSIRSIRRLGCRREPAFIDASAMAAERIQIVGVKL